MNYNFPKNPIEIENYIYSNMFSTILNKEDFVTDITQSQNFDLFNDFYIEEFKKNIKLVSEIKDISSLVFNFFEEIQQLLNYNYRVFFGINSGLDIVFNLCVCSPEFNIGNKEIKYFNNINKISINIDTTGNEETLNLKALESNIFVHCGSKAIKKVFSQYIINTLNHIQLNYKKELFYCNKDMLDIETVLKFFNKNGIDPKDILKSKSTYYNINEIIKIFKEHDSILSLQNDKTIIKKIEQIETNLKKRTVLNSKTCDIL